ncbi:MAG TPA: radical SAM protein [Anaeromyxobacter sp.]|nr:radical SAM protein [Anaeromyxobacter sp.]
MRIRLVQPPLVQPLYRQLTLPVVGAELAAAGLEVEACDENVEELDESDVDLVGVTCHVYNAPRAFAIADRFRARGIPVILGGTFPTIAPHLVRRHADSVVVGEVEGLAAAIAADARAGRLRPVYRADAPPSLERTARPDWSLLDVSRYLRFNFPVELSRGCRFACRFCTQGALFPTPRVRALRDVERDLGQHDHGLVEVVDVNFLNDPHHFRRAAPLLRAAPGPGWMGQTTVADLAADPTLPARLAESRCRAVFVGVESITPDGLRSIHKSWSRPEDFLEVARRLREAGVLVQAGLVVGLDGDDRATLAAAARFFERARAQSVSITWLHYVPGTRAHAELAAGGRRQSAELRDYDGTRPVIEPAGASPDALVVEVGRFLDEVYSWRSILRRAMHRGMLRRPGQLLHHLVVNAALRGYYRAGGRGPWTVEGERYLRAPRPSRAELRGAAVGAWLLDRALALAG